MVALPNKSTRDSINLDSFEKSILYSAFLLHNILSKTEDYKGSIKITKESKNFSYYLEGEIENKLESCCTVEFQLPYEQGDFLTSNGDFLNSVKELSTEISTYSNGNLDPSENPLNIQEPSFVDNLEKFSLWVGNVYIALLSGYIERVSSVASFSFFDGAKIPYFKLAVSIPIDNDKYLQSSNLTNSTKQIVKSLTTVEPPQPQPTDPFNSDHENSATQPQANNPTSEPIDLILEIQNNIKDKGSFEKQLLNQYDKINGWSINYWIVNGSVVQPSDTTQIQIKENGKNVAFLKLKKYSIQGYFRSANYADELTFDGNITLNYQLKSELENNII